jgi:hypothetical protein
MHYKNKIKALHISENEEEENNKTKLGVERVSGRLNNKLLHFRERELH